MLKPSGYLLRWIDTYHLCEADHLRVADVCRCVDLIAWDNLRPGTAIDHDAGATICWCCKSRRLLRKAHGETTALPIAGRKKSTVASIPTSNQSD